MGTSVGQAICVHEAALGEGIGRDDLAAMVAADTGCGQAKRA